MEAAGGVQGDHLEAVVHKRLGLEGEKPSHPCHKELGGGVKKKIILSHQRGDLAAPSPWRAWYLVFAALGKDLTKPNIGLHF